MMVVYRGPTGYSVSSVVFHLTHWTTDHGELSPEVLMDIAKDCGLSCTNNL